MTTTPAREPRTANRSPLFAASAAVISAMALLTSPAPAQAVPMFPLAPPSVCTFTSNIFRVFRSDGQLATPDVQLNGTEFGPKANVYLTADNPTELDTSHGTVSGSLRNFSMDFTINAGKAESYHGEVVVDGSVTGWVVGSKPQINWDSKPGSVACGSQTTGTGTTARVNSDVDVYRFPDPDNNPDAKTAKDKKPIGMARKDKQVTLLERRADNWCHISGPEVPTGDGWAYGDFIVG